LSKEKGSKQKERRGTQNQWGFSQGEVRISGYRMAMENRERIRDAVVRGYRVENQY
jgi:hypothetical protein